MPVTGIIRRILFGFVIGASMLLPGVSGGSMAIILGIYGELIDAVGTIRRNTAHKLAVLGCYILGGIIGVILLSRPLLALVEKQPVISGYLFMGAIIACIPSLYRLAVNAEDTEAEGFVLDGIPISPSVTRNKRVPVRPLPVIGGALGLIIGAGLYFIPEGLVADTEDAGIISLLIMFAAGIIIAIALVLPGISGSYVLLVLGLYDEMLTAVNEMNILHLAPFVLGIIIGILATTKLIDYLMKRFPQFIFFTIIGFMIGSLAQVFPGLPRGWDIPLSAAALVVGFLLITLLGVFSRPAADRRYIKEMMDDERKDRM
ncbi:MAG: DUF368 domain-containing protein [Clostridiales Family XIII bacterium]|jgi:putative membrane protein|nr:DUF368 domain-containing protein [Clostridiales Family XIII bacterium]